MVAILRIAPRALVFAVLAALLVVVAAGRHADAAGTLLVGLQPDQSEDTLQGTLAATGARVSDRIDQLNLLVVETSFGGTERTIRRLRDLPAVRYVERDVALPIAAGPNDTGYLDGRQWNLDRIHAPEAWPLVPGDGKTIVAVLDSGVDYTHPDLSGQVLPLGCDQFRTGCVAGDGRAPLDTIGHGTHVAGIIAAKTNNGVGVASVTGGRASILAVRLSARASSSINGADALRGVVYAVDHGAKVINMSFGGPCGTPQSDPWRDAVSYAHDRDVLMVIAAGNEGEECLEGKYPANDPRVLSVAATDIEGFSPLFTTTGPWVGVAAPGVRIYSTFVNGGYQTISGTSMATPHVTGLAALLYQVPGATKAKVMEWIKSTCDRPVDGNQCGGLINAYRAVHLAVKGVDPGQSSSATGPPTPAVPPPMAPPGPSAP